MERYLGYAREDDEDDNPPPDMSVLVHDFDDVADQYHALMSFHALPDTGGWQDQDAGWTDDLLLFDSMAAWVRRQHEDDAPPAKGGKQRNPWDLLGADEDGDLSGTGDIFGLFQ